MACTRDFCAEHFRSGFCTSIASETTLWTESVFIIKTTLLMFPTTGMFNRIPETIITGLLSAHIAISLLKIFYSLIAQTIAYIVF
jgi:hypothetical protein